MDDLCVHSRNGLSSESHCWDLGALCAFTKSTTLSEKVLSLSLWSNISLLLFFFLHKVLRRCICELNCSRFSSHLCISFSAGGSGPFLT